MPPVAVTLRWKGHSDADASTQYEIRSDVATPNDYLVLTTRTATEPYAPVFTTLNGAIVAGAKSLIMSDASGFANNEYANIDREAFLLSGKSGSAFNNVTGGQYATIPQDHKTGSFIYKMHEVYPIASVDFGIRHVVRYRIIAILGTERVVAAEAVAVQPTPPLTNDKITLWGIQDRSDGTPHPGVSVKLAIQPKGFAPGTAESLDVDPQTVTTDASGYWQVTGHRDVAKNGGVMTLTIDNQTYELKRLPDVDTICYLECL